MAENDFFVQNVEEMPRVASIIVENVKNDGTTLYMFNQRRSTRHLTVLCNIPRSMTYTTEKHPTSCRNFRQKVKIREIN